MSCSWTGWNNWRMLSRKCTNHEPHHLDCEHSTRFCCPYKTNRCRPDCRCTRRNNLWSKRNHDCPRSSSGTRKKVRFQRKGRTNWCHRDLLPDEQRKFKLSDKLNGREKINEAFLTSLQPQQNRCFGILCIRKNFVWMKFILEIIGPICYWKMEFTSCSKNQPNMLALQLLLVVTYIV